MRRLSWPLALTVASVIILTFLTDATQAKVEKFSHKTSKLPKRVVGDSIDDVDEEKIEEIIEDGELHLIILFCESTLSPCTD